MYGILEKGLLTGAFSKERVEDLPMDDHRKRDPLFNGLEFEDSLRSAGELERQALQVGRTPAQLAISKILGNSSVCSAIIGARTIKQLEENVKHL